MMEVATLQTVLKFALTAALVVLIAEVSKRSTLLGGLIASLPMTSVLAMMWLWRDTHDSARLAEYASATFWWVLPSLVLFLVLPPLLRRGLSFPSALAAGCACTMAAYVAMFRVLRWLGVAA